MIMKWHQAENYTIMVIIWCVNAYKNNMLRPGVKLEVARIIQQLHLIRTLLFNLSRVGLEITIPGFL